MPSGATGGGSMSSSRICSVPPHPSITIARMTAFLPSALAAEHVGGERVHAVEEQQPVEVVELMLQAARLEALGADDAAGGLHRDRGRAADVGGQLGDAQAALAPHLRAGGGDDPRVDEHEPP